MTSILRPCPFCGGQGLLALEGEGEDRRPVVRCLDCEAEAGGGGVDTVLAWNRRPGEDRLILVIEAEIRELDSMAARMGPWADQDSIAARADRLRAAAYSVLSDGG